MKLAVFMGVIYQGCETLRIYRMFPRFQDKYRNVAIKRQCLPGAGRLRYETEVFAANDEGDIVRLKVGGCGDGTVTKVIGYEWDGWMKVFGYKELYGGRPRKIIQAGGQKLLGPASPPPVDTMGGV